MLEQALAARAGGRVGWRPSRLSGPGRRPPTRERTSAAPHAEQAGRVVAEVVGVVVARRHDREALRLGLTAHDAQLAVGDLEAAQHHLQTAKEDRVGASGGAPWEARGGRAHLAVLQHAHEVAALERRGHVVRVGAQLAARQLQ